MTPAIVRRCLSSVVAITAALAMAAPPVAAQPAPGSAAQTGSTFTPITPERVLDTRIGLGAPREPVASASSITLNLSARIPTSATAVVLNVTGTEPTAATFVTVFPHGQQRPLASSLNLLPGQTAPNQVTVQVGPDGQLDLYNNAGSTHLVADLAGYYATGQAAKFTVLRPDRVYDSRTSGNGNPIGQGRVVTLELTGRVPAGTAAVTFNLTGTEATADTFVTAWPDVVPRPFVSNLNLVAGDTRPNLVTVALGPDLRVSLYNNFGQVHLIMDLAGFYTRDYGALFFPTAPKRVLDTRTGAGTPLAPGQVLPVDLGPDAPNGTTSAVLNLTGVEPNAPTFISAWPELGPQPPTSNLNLTPGQTAPNAAVVGLGTNRFNLFSSNAFVHMVVDLAGLFAFDLTPCQSNCVATWGDNNLGQLGTGQTFGRFASPATVISLSGVTAVAGGIPNNGYALKSDGTVVSWGDNFRGQLGNGWSSFESPVAAPVPVVGLSGVTAIATAFRIATTGIRTIRAGVKGAWECSRNSRRKGHVSPVPDDAGPS